jgi:hypothetical protein
MSLNVDNGKGDTNLTDRPVTAEVVTCHGCLDDQESNSILFLKLKLGNRKASNSWEQKIQF